MTTGGDRADPPAAAARQRRAPIAWLRGQVAALAGAVAVAGLIGGLIISAYGESPLEVYRTIWVYSTAEPADVAQVLENATPLIFSALAVAVAFRAGMFNIGVEGQYKVGMIMAAAVATSAEALPGPLLLVAVLLAAAAGGALWAGIPGLLKVRTGAHEVVTTIMMNGIAVSLVAWSLNGPLRTSEQGLIDLRTDVFPQGALVPKVATSLGLEGAIPPSVHLTWLFPAGLLAAALVWFFLFRTRLGYEARAVGYSAGAAEAGGVSVAGAQLKVFLISGALAGFVGLNHILGDRGFMGSNYQSGLGFAGIAVAFLGRNHPFGAVAAALLIGMLERGQNGIAITTDLPTEILIILQGLLILSVVVAYELGRRAVRRRRQSEERAAESAADTTVAVPGSA